MRERFGPRSTRLGFIGFGVLLLAFVLTAVALSSGVHCPECDRHHLTDAQFEFWKTYFAAKDGVYLMAAAMLAVASPFATPRRWPFVFGLVLAIFAAALTPM